MINPLLTLLLTGVVGAILGTMRNAFCMGSTNPITEWYMMFGIGFFAFYRTSMFLILSLKVRRCL